MMKDYRAELDDITYDGWLGEQVWFFLQRDPLYDLTAARQQAQEFMDVNYRRRSDVMQNECQHDYQDERDGDWTR